MEPRDDRALGQARVVGDGEVEDLVARRHPALDRIGRHGARQHDDVDSVLLGRTSFETPVAGQFTRRPHIRYEDERHKNNHAEGHRSGLEKDGSG